MFWRKVEPEFLNCNTVKGLIERACLPVYALTLAKNGAKLHRVAEGSCTPMDRTKPREPDQKPLCDIGRAGKKGANRTFDTLAQSMTEFARFIGDFAQIDRPVIDKTGIAGRFAFHLEFARDETVLPDETAGPSIFNALQQQRGLKLEPTKGQRDFLVIDHVERPTGN